MPTSTDKLKQIAAGVDNERRYALLWPVLVIEIALGVVLGLRSTSSPQAYDTHTYAVQALQLASGDGSWLATGAHNYLYPAFLAVLHMLGLWGNSPLPASPADVSPLDGRLGVGVVQIALLYAASLFLMAVLSRCLRARLVSIGVVVCGVAILPAAAWSGYWLSESLAAPLLLVIIALWVWTCYSVLLRPGSMSTMAIICGLGLASGSAWMTRPALIWVPAVVGLLLGLMILASTLWLRTRHHDLSVPPPSYLRAVGLIAAFLFGAALSLVPQLAFDSSIADAFKLNLAGQQAQGSSTIWRYATNVSGCGSPGLAFSPLSTDVAPMLSGQIQAPSSPVWWLTTAAAHLVSGWDPLPSPNYATSLTLSPWIYATMVSGFLVAAPLLIFSWLVSEMRSLWAGWRLRAESSVDMSRFAFAASIAGLLVFFGVTQVELLGTATEFRFNLMGWLSAGACLVFLIASGGLSRKRLALYVSMSVSLSAVILIIGQMTLDYSAYWLACR
jgi:hypothetical protein